jgi:hypothetical protein
MDLEGALLERDSKKFATTDDAAKSPTTLGSQSATVMLRDDPESLTDAAKRSDGRIDIGMGMGGGELNANARLAFGHNGVGKANHVDTLAEKLRRSLLCEFRLAEHDWDDRMNAFLYVESRFRHLFSKVFRVLH